MPAWVTVLSGDLIGWIRAPLTSCRGNFDRAGERPMLFGACYTTPNRPLSFPSQLTRATRKEGSQHGSPCVNRTVCLRSPSGRHRIHRLRFLPHTRQVWRVLIDTVPRARGINHRLCRAATVRKQDRDRRLLRTKFRPRRRRLHSPRHETRRRDKPYPAMHRLRRRGPRRRCPV